MNIDIIRTLIDMQSQSPTEPGNLTAILKHIAETAHSLFAADLAVMIAINPSSKRLRPDPTVIGDVRTGIWAAAELQQLEHITWQVLEQKVLVVEDLATVPAYQRLFHPQEGIQALAAIALYTRRHNPLAVLYLLLRQPRQFTADERNYFHMFAQSASVVLQKTRLVRRYHEVARIGQEINQDLETAETLFQRLHRHTGGIVDTSHYLLLAVVEPQIREITFFLTEAGTYRVPAPSAVAGVMACQWVLDAKEPLVIQHFSEQKDQLPAPVLYEFSQQSKTFESLIFLPLLLRDVALGVLAIQHVQPHVYDDEDVYLLRLLGNHIAVALSNIRLYDNVRRLSETGQILTRHLTATTVLQEVVERICDVTRAAQVMLYGYKSGVQSFELPPHVAGEAQEPIALHPSPTSAIALPLRVLNQGVPIFAKDSTELYHLGANALGHPVSPDPAQQEAHMQIRSTAALPLHIADELLGVLFIHFRQPQRFDAPQKQLIEGLANYAAIAIKNARLFGALALRREEELELLRTIDRAISSTLDLQHILETILSLATQRIAVDGASILLYNARTQALDMHAPIGRHVALSQDWRTIPLNQQKGITRWVFEHKKPVRVGNVITDPVWRDIYHEVSPGTLSELDVPLLDGEQVIGVINFESTRENAFSQEDQVFLVVLAGQAVLAIKNAQAYERERRIAEERQALIEISQLLAAELDRSKVFALILDKALEITHSRVGTLMIYDPRRNDLWMADERGVIPAQKDARHSLNEGIVGLAAREQRLYNVGDVTQPPWKEIYLPYIIHMHSELAVPMREGNVLRGVINIESDTVNAFDERDERLLTTLADLAVIVLQNAEQYERADQGHQRLKALHTVNLEIIAQFGDNEQVVQAILEQALRLTQAEAVGLYWYTDGVVTRIDRACLDQQDQFQRLDPTPAPPAAAHQHKPGIIATVAATSKPYVTMGDAQDDPYYVGTLDIHSEVAVPLLNDGRVIGVINLESQRPYAFDAQVVEVLELFAGQTVIAIQNARAYAQAESHARRFRLLYQAGRTFGEIADRTQIDQAYAIVSQTTQELGHIQTIIRRYDPVTHELVLAHYANTGGHVPEVRKPPDDGLNWQVAHERQMIVRPDVQPELTSSNPDSWTRSRVMIPVQFREHYYGNLGLNHDQANYFREADVTLFEGLAQQLAITIYRLEAVQAQREAEQQARELEFMSSFGQAAFELAHRLGNELGLVRSYINNVRQELDARGVDRTPIDNDLNKVVRDVTNVLKLSRDLKTALTEGLQTKTPAQEKVVITLQEVVTRIMQSETLLLEQITLQVDLAPERLLIRAVPVQIEDILRNVLVNAIEALAGSGTITIRARSAGSVVELQVEDDGPGITPERQARIFDLFYSTKGSFGFGLWSSRRNALAHGGDLSVQSQPGVGTIVTLTLPKAEHF